MGWDGMGWDGMGWDGMGWDGMGWIVERRDQDVSLGSRASSRRFSSDIFHGKNGSIAAGACPPFWAQLCRNQVSHLRMLIWDKFRVANREKSIAVSRPLHKVPEL